MKLRLLCVIYALSLGPWGVVRAEGGKLVHMELARRDGRDRLVLELVQGGAVRSHRRSEDHRLHDLLVSGSATPQVRKAASRLRGQWIRSLQVQSARRGLRVRVKTNVPTRCVSIEHGDRHVFLFSKRDEVGLSSTTVAKDADVAGFLDGLVLQPQQATKRYRGRRVNLDLKDADIHNVLRLLAAEENVNIVTSDDVKGTVTIRLRRVPWDEALEVVLKAKGLGMERRGNLIRVAPQDVLEKEREVAIARQKQRKLLAPLETRLIPVSYAVAEELMPRVKELMSERGSVSVDARTNALIVRDITANLNDVEALVRTLDTQTPQVLVEARIVEASSQYVKDVGVQWGGDVTLGSATGNPTGLVFPSSVGVAGGNFDQDTPTQGLSPIASAVDPSNFAVNLPAVTGTGQGGALGLTFGSLGGNVNLNVRLSAAEANGSVKIVSSPRILTLDNREAHIAQGTLIPYSQISAQGVQTAFQEAKLELQVKPHVTSDGSISMHVRVTRDEPDFTRTSSRGDPTILKREAETDLLVVDGDTAVIGGIYTRNTGRNVDQVPFFGDIPILGVLFKRRRLRDDRSELLIFLTPRIVNRERALRAS